MFIIPKLIENSWNVLHNFTCREGSLNRSIAIDQSVRKEIAMEANGSAFLSSSLHCSAKYIQANCSRWRAEWRRGKAWTNVSNNEYFLKGKDTKDMIHALESRFTHNDTHTAQAFHFVLQRNQSVGWSTRYIALSLQIDSAQPIGRNTTLA